jgi:hypothetical protein
MSSRRARRRLGAILGKAWNAPNTLVGLLLGLPALALGASLRRGHNALQILAHPAVLPRCAITLGNVVLYGRGATPDDPTFAGATLGEHERQHTLQGERLGPCYLPSHVLSGLHALLRDGRWHGPSNWNERGPMSSPPRPWAPRRATASMRATGGARGAGR